MRHLGWLHATPEGSKKSRLRSYKDSDENSSFLKLPEIEGAEYLVALFKEAGMYESTGMGIASLTWTEITNWQNSTESRLTVWEKLAIKEMSEAYVSEYSQASEKDREPPYLHVEKDIDRGAIARKLKSVFRSLKRNPTGAGEPTPTQQENKD